MLQKLKSQFRQKIKDDEVLQVKIATAFQKKIITVKRWNESDHPILTTTTVLEIIREHEGLSEGEELTEEKELAAA